MFDIFRYRYINSLEYVNRFSTQNYYQTQLLYIEGHQHNFSELICMHSKATYVQIYPYIQPLESFLQCDSIYPMHLVRLTP